MNFPELLVAILTDQADIPSLPDSELKYTEPRDGMSPPISSLVLLRRIARLQTLMFREKEIQQNSRPDTAGLQAIADAKGQSFYKAMIDQGPMSDDQLYRIKCLQCLIIEIVRGIYPVMGRFNCTFEMTETGQIRGFQVNNSVALGD